MLGRLGAPLITAIDRPGHIFTLCFAILFLGRRSGFRAGFRPDSKSGNDNNRLCGRPSAGRGSRLESDRDKIRPGSQSSGPEAILRNIWSMFPVRV